MLYGFLSGTSFGGGMILAQFMLGTGIAGEALVATVAVGGVMLNVAKTIAFGLFPPRAAGWRDGPRSG